ncbi:hypothetical protein P7C70_g3096, partial [Phenoliferia sp. Uapishka_3]
MLSPISLARSARTLAFRSSRPFATSSVPREHFLNASPATFDAQAVKGDRVTLVDFYADWCGGQLPIRLLVHRTSADPILFKFRAMSHAYTHTQGGRYTNWRMMTVNTDDQQNLAAQFKIASLPTVIAFKNGEVLAKFIGVKNKAGVAQWLKVVQAKA